MEVTVTALDTDVHSGIYGGNVMNSAITLAQIITRLKGEDGTIKIPGFYDKVRKITAKEKAELAKYPFSSEDIMAETGSLKITGEKGYSIPARAGARPTLDINGIWGGYQGEGAKTVIPKSASAKISMRLVPNQSSAEIANKFRKFVNKIAPKGVRVEIKELTGSEPVLIDRDSRYFKVAESILTKTFGNKPVYELSGGSIGVVVDFKKSLRIDSLLIGYGLPDDGLHAPNEKMNLGMIEKGIESNVKIIKELGARSPSTSSGSSTRS
jgi:acetylornithine deacetylase/succinyl-diaminopimelate desuccinylase-like protein